MELGGGFSGCVSLERTGWESDESHSPGGWTVSLPSLLKKGFKERTQRGMCISCRLEVGDTEDRCLKDKG